MEIKPDAYMLWWSENIWVKTCPLFTHLHRLQFTPFQINVHDIAWVLFTSSLPSLNSIWGRILVTDSLINLLLSRRIAAMGPHEQEEGNEEKNPLSLGGPLKTSPIEEEINEGTNLSSPQKLNAQAWLQSLG